MSLTAGYISLSVRIVFGPLVQVYSSKVQQNQKYRYKYQYLDYMKLKLCFEKYLHDL